MINVNNPRNIRKIDNDNSMADNAKILSEFTKKNIEKSYKLESIKDTEAYFSNRYGWTLRKIKD